MQQEKINLFSITDKNQQNQSNLRNIIQTLRDFPFLVNQSVDLIDESDVIFSQLESLQTNDSLIYQIKHSMDNCNCKLLLNMVAELIYINNYLDMGLIITQVFTKIPQETFELAINSSLLLAAAVSIFYLFFGRLFSFPEILSNILKYPTSQSSRNSFIIIAGVIFTSSLVKTLYHEHFISFYPYDEDTYLKNISTLRLIVSGILVGVGSQIAILGRQNCGILGLPTFSLRSLVTTITVFGTTMLTITYKVASWVPQTPRIIQIANNSLPKNISFDSFLLVTLLVPFIIFLFSSKKSLKGMIESLLYFAVGILLGCFIMFFGFSEIQKSQSYFRYTKKWTGEVILALAMASFVFGIVFAIVKYGFKKPLFSNELQDKPSKITGKLILGSILVGIGFGLGGLLFESFLFTVPASSLRIIIFWGLPYIFSMKATQVISERSTLPSDKKN